jgi:hypothetical protein
MLAGTGLPSGTRLRTVPVTAPVEPAGDPPTDSSSAPVRRRPRLARWAAVAVCVAILALWAFVYVWAARQKPVDRLASPTFGQKAEKICAATLTRLRDLPPAGSSKTNVARAGVVDQSNVELGSMLSRLADAAPTTSHDGRMVREWLADYHTYLSNRVDYADRLRTDPSARFYETEKQPGEQITIPIDTFATANDMDSCTAPEDLS